MADGDNSTYTTTSQPVKTVASPKNFTTSTPRSPFTSCNTPEGHNDNVQPDVKENTLLSAEHVQNILHSLSHVIQFLQSQEQDLPPRSEEVGATERQIGSSGQRHIVQDLKNLQEACVELQEEYLVGERRDRGIAGLRNRTLLQSPSHSYMFTEPKEITESMSHSHRSSEKPKTVKKEKERKSITPKTFAKGMMDVSLLTSNATQLRSVISSPNHEFYTLLLWLISISVLLQIVSSVLMIVSDFYKTQVKEVDRQNQRKRKILSFLSLALITLVTSLNVLISVFYSPGMGFHRQPESSVPQFSASSYLTNSHSEL